MDELAWIMDRRSIRRFKNKDVDDEAIKQILEAAMFAPSAVNKQPWHFIVVRRRDLLEKIMQIHPHAGMLRTASHGIVVCGDEHLQHDDGYWVVDCGAATQNLLLAAHLLGLGACWVGLHPREARKQAFTELLGLPSHVKPFALVALGYPDEQKARPLRFRPERVRLDGWDRPFFSE